VQLVESLGSTAEVVRSDAESAEQMLARRPEAVILSPGPGRPEAAGCFEALAVALDDDTPLLGVCLGHQALGEALGGRIERGPVPMHGKASRVYHEGAGILAGLPNPFEAGRYHSLVVAPDALPEHLELTAWTEDGVVMGVQHRTLPRFGVQFHPESILTPDGPRIIESFLALRRAG
jgi:anthranilate synthase component II